MASVLLRAPLSAWSHGRWPHHRQVHGHEVTCLDRKPEREGDLERPGRFYSHRFNRAKAHMDSTFNSPVISSWVLSLKGPTTSPHRGALYNMQTKGLLCRCQRHSELEEKQVPLEYGSERGGTNLLTGLSNQDRGLTKIASSYRK